MILAQRAINNQSTTHEETDYDVITAYVMEDNNSIVQQSHELHSGPPSVRVSIFYARYLVSVKCRISSINKCFIWTLEFEIYRLNNNLLLRKYGVGYLVIVELIVLCFFGHINVILLVKIIYTSDF